MNACKGSRSRGRAGRGEPASLVLKAAESVIVAVPVLYHIPNYLLPQEIERREREKREREKRESVCICDCDCERETKAVIGILFARCFVIVIVIVIVVVVGACDGP